MKHLFLEDLIQLIKTKQVTIEEVWNYFHKRIQAYNPTLKAFTFVGETPRTDAETLPLAGIPIAVKDIFCETGIPTTCSSKMLQHFIPPYDATVIKRLKNAGMSSIGKTNMDEFAMGSSTENSAFFPSLNPWGNNRIPGGSSGGSAVAVAAGLCPASLGTDTGGSIRQPASMCGVVGFKPSYGRNSRFGVIAMASSLDCPGTFTRSVKDAGILYEIMNGYDEKEETTIDGKDILASDIWEKDNLKNVRIGIPKEYFGEGLESGVRDVIHQSLRTLEERGASIEEISLPMTHYCVATYYIIMAAEVSTNLGRYDGIRYGHVSTKHVQTLDEMYEYNRGEGFGKEVKRRILLGSYVLSAGFYDAYYKKATQVRTLICEDFRRAFETVDILVAPVSPTVAWKLGEKLQDPLQMYLSDIYTIPASLAGLPAISIPAGFAQSNDEEKEMLPVGIQIIGPQYHDQKVLQVGHVFEKYSGWSYPFPPHYEKELP